MKLKPGTKISLLFAIFTFVISLFLLTFINVYTFFNWYNAEEVEIMLKLEQQYKEVLDEYKTTQSQKVKLTQELKEKGGFIGINKQYRKYIFDIYTLGKSHYFLIYKDTKFGKITIPYKATLYINNQLNLLYISIIGLLFFSFLSFFISKILFIKYALKNVFNVTNNISHEFKTPLMVISSQIEYAIKSKKYEDSFLKIEKQIDILNGLLETFLFISKIQNSKIPLKLKQINISKLVNEILIEYQNIYASKNILVGKNIPNDIFIKTDEKMFSLIIKNLVDNSFKYTNNSGKIEVNLDEKSFKIKDNGIGINKDKLENIFDIFYREGDDNKGYGVGLNIVKKIADILGYKISINTEKGKGSEFEIKFN